ncbi:MAG: FAD:protein FMN transferase [Wenzhouxiangellaceae bacterium]
MILLAASLIAACGSGTEIRHYSGLAQGTTYHLSLVVPAGFDAAPVHRAVIDEFARIDQTFSNYRRDSVIERFNRSRSTDPVEVGPGLVELVAKAARVHEASLGCFDPTIVPLSQLWQQSARSGRLPSEEAVDVVRQRIGMGDIEVIDALHLAKRRADLALDLSGIAQGESLARLADVVESAGIEAYAIEIGGEVLLRGARPGGGPWRVALLDPVHTDRVLGIRIEHRGETRLAVTTSASSAPGSAADHPRPPHILDPRTGRPVAHDTVAVTVVHTDPALADAWSTALLCLGREAGMAVAERNRIAVLFVRSDGAIAVSKTWPGTPP